MFRLYYSYGTKGFGVPLEVHFHLTEKAAKKRIESTVVSGGGYVEFSLEKGKLVFRHTAPVWREVPKVPVIAAAQRGRRVQN